MSNFQNSNENDPQRELEEEGCQEKAMAELDEAEFAEALARHETKPLRNYNVVLQNDDSHTIEYVVDMLMKVCGMTEKVAVETTLKVHEEGSAVVFRSHMEHCELKSQQISSFGKDDLAIKSGIPCDGSMTSYVQPE